MTRKKLKIIFLDTLLHFSLMITLKIVESESQKCDKDLLFE